MELFEEQNGAVVPSEPNLDDVHANASVSNKDPFKFSHGLTGVDQPANYLFVNILIATILAPALLAALFRVYVYFRNDRRRVSVVTSCRGHNFWRKDRHMYWGLLKKHFLYAPLMGDRHSRELQLLSFMNTGTIPTRPQLLVIVGYVASNIAYCFAIPNQLPAQRFAEFRGRSGALAAFNLIFTVLFALRNNPFIWILDISYDTFNLFHRWTARLVILESVVHVTAFMCNTYRVTYNGQSGWDSIRWVIGHSISYRWGLTAFMAYLFLGLQSLGPLRRAFYDTFLSLHRLGVAVAICGVYFHMAKHALPQLSWAYLFTSLLVLELSIRIGRLIYYNLSFRQRSWTRVTAEALPGEATRVTFTVPQSWNRSPGSHTYVYLPRISAISSHPFSIAWSRSSGYARSDVEKLPSSVEDLKIQRELSEISCIVRARTGMTRALYDRVSKAKSERIELWGVVEGLYGTCQSLDSYGTVVLFAAGTGITHQLAFVRHLLAGYGDNTTATRKILLVWCIPNIEIAEWIHPWLEEIASMPHCSEILQIWLYVSRTTPLSTQTTTLPIQAEIYMQRCKPQEILDDQILTQVGAMAVTVCGPGGFNDSVRAAVRHRVCLRSIDFFEEAFSS